MKLFYISCGAMVVIAAILTTGCVDPKVRKGADLLATFTHQVSEEGTAFVQSRTLLAQARRANIAMLEMSGVELENAVSQDVEIWRLSGDAGKRRVELIEGMRLYANTAASRNEELETLRKKQNDSIAAAKSAVEFRQAELSKVSKALASIAKEPDIQSEIEFFNAYFKEVSTDINKAKNDADLKVQTATVQAVKSTILPNKTKSVTEEIK